MNKNKFYVLVIVGLLLSNLLLAGFMFFGKKGPHRKHQKPREKIIERLSFDEQQIEQYDKLIAGHQKDIKEKDKQLVELKNELYALLPGTDTGATADSLINEITGVIKQIERIHFDHFLDIKGLCKPDQMAAFEELTEEIGKIFSPKPPPKK